MTAFRAAFKAYRMHQVLLLPRFARLTIALGLATAVFPVDAEYYFNPRFLSNDLAESVDLSAFTKGREALMNPLMILVKIIKLRWIHILSYDQMVSRKINNQTTRCANSI
ncbi:hypothetical protein, partial [Escherichia coli]|uniref:hypothetical protein n=1 Tax=Escherichia coli TaxID=562 RepID=UPI0020775F99